MSINHLDILTKAKNVFALNPAATNHGPRHWEQVLMNVIELSKHEPDCDIDVATLFALLHDCKRQNENTDPEHGLRASKYVQQLYDEGHLDISEDQLEVLQFALEFHNSGGTAGKDVTIGVCWDADRLDLPRVGKITRPELLSTETAKKIIKGDKK